MADMRVGIPLAPDVYERADSAIGTIRKGAPSHVE